MEAETLISVEEYLKSTYRPDCDLVDGEVLERNMGEGQHARIQGFLSALFFNNRKTWAVNVLPEMRVQVAPRRFRIPDLSVLEAAIPLPRIIRQPPLLCIEILSSEDRLSRMLGRIIDYTSFGVPHIWVIDPWKREAFYASAAGYAPVLDGFLQVPGTPISISLDELFAELEGFSD